MGFVGYKHSDKDIKAWARQYSKGGTNLETMENQLNVSHSTIWWCFQHRLYNIDDRLYFKVLERLDYNKRHHIKNHKEGK